MHHSDKLKILIIYPLLEKCRGQSLHFLWVDFLTYKMKIIKFGKPGCAPCESVDSFLKNAKVPYETINPFETEEFDLIIKHRIKNVPITILFDDQENLLTRVAGVDERKLNRLIEIYNNGE